VQATRKNRIKEYITNDVDMWPKDERKKEKKKRKKERRANV